MGAGVSFAIGETPLYEKEHNCFVQSSGEGVRPWGPSSAAGEVCRGPVRPITGRQILLQVGHRCSWSSSLILGSECWWLLRSGEAGAGVFYLRVLGPLLFHLPSLSSG